MLVQLIVFVNKDQTTFNNNKKNHKKQNKIDFSKINLHILKCYLNKSGDSNQYFSSSFSLSFNSIDVFQFLKGWSNLFHNKHPLKETQLIPIVEQLVFGNFNTGLFLKLVVTCLSGK